MKKTRYFFGELIPKIITIILLVVIILTLFMPWVYIGVKGENRNYDLNSIMRAEFGSSVSISSIFEEAAKYADNTEGMKFAIWNGKRIAKHLEDSKLSFAETAVTLLELAHVLVASENFFAIDDGLIVLFFFVAFILLILLAILFIELLSSIKHLVLNNREPTSFIFLVYAICLGLIIFLTIVVNIKTQEGTEKLSYIFGLSSQNILHLRIAPFCGLLCAAILKYSSRILHGVAIVIPSYTMRLPSVPIEGVLNGVNNTVGWRCDCGKWNFIRAAYCSKCGAKRISKNVCVSCGAKRIPGSKFCHKCGLEYPKTEGISTVKKKNICPNCGKTIREGASFCGNCGERYRKVVINPSPVEEDEDSIGLSSAEPRKNLPDISEADTRHYSGRHTPG